MTTSLLHPGDAQRIQESAISPDIAAERGYRTVTPPEARALGFADWQARTGLLVPIHGVTGAQTLYQLRPHNPRMGKAKEGKKPKPIKYETIAGASMQIDCPPCFLASLSDPTVPLLLTEGVRKIDSFASAVRREQLQVCGIAFLGVWNWRNRFNVFKESIPLLDWGHIALKDRIVYICFDSDSERIENVGLALTYLQAFLEDQGAKVQFITLPDDVETTGEERGRAKKVGLDDWLAQEGHTVRELLTLAKDDSEEPTAAFLRLRKSTLGRGLRGIADVNMHGGLTFGKEVTQQEIERAIQCVKGLYEPAERTQRWDLMDTWFAFLDRGYCPVGQMGAYQDALFGFKAQTLRNWISALGHFAHNREGRRRPELPPWLHELLIDANVSAAQETVLFDTFQGHLHDGHFMKKEEVMKMIHEQTGFTFTERKTKERPTPNAIEESENHWIQEIFKDKRWKVIAQTCDPEIVKIEMERVFAQLLRVKETEEVNPTFTDREKLDSPLRSATSEMTVNEAVISAHTTLDSYPIESISNKVDHQSDLTPRLVPLMPLIMLPEPQCICNVNTLYCPRCDADKSSDLESDVGPRAEPPSLPACDPQIGASEEVTACVDLESVLAPFLALLSAARARAFPCVPLCVDAAAGVCTEDLNLFVIRKVNACKAAYEARDGTRLQMELRLLTLCQERWQALNDEE